MTQTPANDPNPSAEVSPVWPASLSEAMLFEVSWEVCHQVGGIYTVLRSKVPSMVRRWGKRYCLVGPYQPEASGLEFEEISPAGRPGQAVRDLHELGFDARYGRWLVTGQPQVALLDWRSVLPKLADAKYLLWEHHGVSLPSEDALIDQVIAFGFLVEQFFRALLGGPDPNEPVVAHFHEWMGSTAVPEIRHAKLPVSTVFTTHATLLGRFLAMHDHAFYDHLPFVDWRAEAERFGIAPEVQLERAAAGAADVFTTISEVTADECEHLLGRRPEVLLPNGLNIERFVAVHEFQNLHRLYKEKIQQFVMAQFFPSYTFDLDKTLFFFSSGRFEYRNKGFDLTLEAMARLNVLLRETGTDRTVVFFLITRRAFRGINSEVLRRRAMLEELRHNCDEIQRAFGDRLFEATAKGLTPDYNALIEDYWRLRLRRLSHALRTGGLPTIVTHDIPDDHEDDVLCQLRYLNLINRQEDPVKIVYHPDFINASSPLFGMEYDHFVRGCHLGVFPSLYEPWGYTPLECIALGVPAVTSDLSGFGTYVSQHVADADQQGIFLVPRRHRPMDSSAALLAEQMLRFCDLNRRERIDLRNRTESAAEQFDWEVLGEHYVQAHALAARKLAERG